MYICLLYMKFIKKGKKITHFMLMKQLELLFIKRFDSIMAILWNQKKYVENV